MTAVEKPDANESAESSAAPPRAAVYAVAALAIFIGGSTPTATKFADDSPFPPEEDLYTDVYVSYP